MSETKKCMLAMEDKIKQLQAEKKDLQRAFKFLCIETTKINNIIQPLWSILREDYMGDCQTFEQKWKKEKTLTGDKT